MFLDFRLQTEARETIPRMLAELNLGRTEKCVRVNSVSSGLAEADLQVILDAEVLPPAVMLPKVEDTQEVQWVRHKFTAQLETPTYSSKSKKRIRVIIFFNL